MFADGAASRCKSSPAEFLQMLDRERVANGERRQPVRYIDRPEESQVFQKFSGCTNDDKVKAMIEQRQQALTGYKESTVAWCLGEVRRKQQLHDVALACLNARVATKGTATKALTAQVTKTAAAVSKAQEQLTEARRNSAAAAAPG